MLLNIKDISVVYGKALALQDVSLQLDQGRVVGIIGANGSGKSTMLKAVSGLISLKSGEIRFMNRRIDNLSTFDIVAQGIVQVPEGRRLFSLSFGAG